MMTLVSGTQNDNEHNVKFAEEQVVWSYPDIFHNAYHEHALVHIKVFFTEA